MSSGWFFGGFIFAIYAGVLVFYNVSHRRRKQRIEAAIAEVRSYNERFDLRYIRASNLARMGSSAVGEHPVMAYEVLADLTEYCIELIVRNRGLHDQEQASPEGTREVVVEASRREEIVAEQAEREEGHHQDR